MRVWGIVLVAYDGKVKQVHMKKIALLMLFFAWSFAVSAQGQKTDKKEVRSEVKAAKSDKKEAKGKQGRAAKKETRAEIKSNKKDKKDIKNK